MYIRIITIIIMFFKLSFGDDTIEWKQKQTICVEKSWKDTKGVTRSVRIPWTFFIYCFVGPNHSAKFQKYISIQ
jgi:hypothetical protein